MEITGGDAGLSNGFYLLVLRKSLLLNIGLFAHKLVHRGLRHWLSA